MGQFSWYTQDTDRQIGNDPLNHIEVYMYDDKGNSWFEEEYEGYGEFEGKDFYELLAEMNGYTEKNRKDYKPVQDNLFDELRSVGIDMYFDPDWDKKGYKSPALIENWRRAEKHDFTKRPKDDPNQGWPVEEDENEGEEFGYYAKGGIVEVFSKETNQKLYEIEGGNESPYYIYRYEADEGDDKEQELIDDLERDTFLSGSQYEEYGEDMLSESEGDSLLYELKNDTNWSDRVYVKENYAKGGFVDGDIVRISQDNDNDNYDLYRNKDLEIIRVSHNTNDHPGYDESVSGMALYDLRLVDSGEDVPFSLYEYEVEGPSTYAKGGKIYKIQQKSKYDIQPKWEDERFQTGGRKFLTYKQAQDFKKKLQNMSSSMQYKVVEDISKSDYAKGGKITESNLKKYLNKMSENKFYDTYEEMFDEDWEDENDSRKEATKTILDYLFSLDDEMRKEEMVRIGYLEEPTEYAKGGSIKWSKNIEKEMADRKSDDFKLGELVYDTRNKRYGTIIGIYDGSPYEVRLDSDGMQPTEFLRKLKEWGDTGTKKQLFEGVASIERLRKQYPENNYPKLINNPFYKKGGKVDMNKHIWEGWTVGDFIEQLDMSYQYHPPFKSRDEVKKWAKSEQPYYKKYIPDVVNHFWAKSQGSERMPWDFEKGGLIASKSQWQEYRAVQDGGYYNMFDPRAREMTSMSREEYVDIIKNYDKYEDKYGRDSDYDVEEEIVEVRRPKLKKK